MQATSTINRVRARRLRHLVIMSDDLAQAWWAGYAINAATWPYMAERCLAMYQHFVARRTALQLAWSRETGLKW